MARSVGRTDGRVITKGKSECPRNDNRISSPGEPEAVPCATSEPDRLALDSIDPSGVSWNPQSSMAADL